MMDYVIFVFQKLFGYSRAKATQLMLQVHNEGKAVVASGTREKCESRRRPPARVRALGDDAARTTEWRPAAPFERRSATARLVSSRCTSTRSRCSCGDHRARAMLIDGRPPDGDVTRPAVPARLPRSRPRRRRKPSAGRSCTTTSSQPRSTAFDVVVDGLDGATPADAAARVEIVLDDEAEMQWLTRAQRRPARRSAPRSASPRSGDFDDRSTDDPRLRVQRRSTPG